MREVCLELGQHQSILSLYWTPLMQRILAKYVKIPAEVKPVFFWFCLPSFCGKNNKSQASPGPYLKRGICHEASLIRLCKEPLQDMAQECMDGWMITAVVSTMVFFIVPSWFAKKKKHVFYSSLSSP